MSSKFFTNNGSQTLLARLAGVFASNKELRAFDVLVGYLEVVRLAERAQALHGQ